MTYALIRNPNGALGLLIDDTTEGDAS